MHKNNNKLILLAFFLIFSTLASSCSTTRQGSSGDPLPILAQDELIRPYTKLGRIQVTRETFTTDYSLTPDIKEWGISAIRQEAQKMGADAIILPEVTGRTTRYGIIPSTEYRATGYAIKFK